MNKEIQSSILRASSRFIRKRLELLEPRFKALETRALVPGPQGEKGAQGAAGEAGAKGLDGADGRSITLDDVLPILKSMQAEWALDFEKRAQGLFQKAVDDIPKPIDGKDGRDGTNGVGWDDMQVEHDGRRGVTLKWIKGDAQHIAEIVIPCVIDAGFFKEGQAYEQGDGVTFGGSYWIAQKATSAKPEVGSEDWRLAVRKGRDGKRD